MSATRVESPQGTEALANYLRTHPESVARPASQLAEEFGLPEAFVRDVAAHLRGEFKRPTESKTSLADMVRMLREALESLKDIFRKTTDRPLVFVAVSTAIGIVSGAAVKILTEGIQRVSSTGSIQIGLEGSFFTLALLVLGAQLACLFRHGMARLAVYSGLIVTVLLLPVFLVPFLNLPQERNVSAATILGVVTTLGLLTFIVYGLIGTGVSVLGGYYRMRHDDTSLRQLSRQQLLDRLLNIREQLAKADSVLVHQPDRAERFLIQYRANAPYFALAAGFIFGAIQVFFTSGAATGDSTSALVMSIITMANFIVGFVVLVCGCFYVKGTRRAVGISALFVIGLYLAELLPLKGFGPAALIQASRIPDLIIALLAAAVVATLAALGAKIEEGASRRRRLRAQDPAALLAESIAIQWQIAPRTHDVCVLVVDAAASSTMKSQADPLVAEWSFREYQRFLEDIAKCWGGTIHSTAGDGAVIAFSSPNDGFAAARAIQTEIDTFNRTTNRLGTPFRLRTGLHMGSMQGELDQVEFHEVIDIAAHVQAAAPLGGIALTSRIAEALEGEQLAELKDHVDNWQVFLAMNPTGS